MVATWANPDSEDPFDQFGLHILHLASHIGDVGLRRDVRQVNIDRLLDGGREGFRLGVGEAGRGKALNRLVCVERADHLHSQQIQLGVRHPPSILGMKKTSEPGRIAWK